MEKMIQGMMKRYALFIAMGFMMVMLAVVIGAVNAANAANYYAVDKLAREASLEWAQVRAGVESTLIWLPYFKFLGVAMILGGITMAVGLIGLKLQNLGKQVMASVPEGARVPIPARPTSVHVMRFFMMMGMMVIIVGFIVSLVVAGTASAVFSNPVTTIDAAEPGSDILNGLAQIHAAEAWLEAFKFVGVASLFLGIVNGLSTIIFALRYQRTAIPQVVEVLSEAEPVELPKAA
jgi:hypothetical protein